MEKTLGGDRIGAGQKEKVHLSNYGRSTQNLSEDWRSSMAAGTLVPFLCKPTLPGDTWDIELSLQAMTLPTIGPLFGFYKIQLDIYIAPLRLYHGLITIDATEIGLNMKDVILPKLLLESETPGATTPNWLDNVQISSSCLYKYLGISGLGYADVDYGTSVISRKFNGIPVIMYYDTYKNYYANKQEKEGAVIHTDPEPVVITITSVDTYLTQPGPIAIPIVVTAPVDLNIYWTEESGIIIAATGIEEDLDVTGIKITVRYPPYTVTKTIPLSSLFDVTSVYEESGIIQFSKPKPDLNIITIGWVFYDTGTERQFDSVPNIVRFDLKQIDTMRKNLMKIDEGVEYIMNDNLAPTLYQLPQTMYVSTITGKNTYSKQFAQEGLALKTYNSDLFNNWLNTEWIEGSNGINEITSVDTTGNSFEIPEMILQLKVYKMLNRVAISGGSYDDWQDAVYSHRVARSIKSPMYVGGLMQNISFHEVTSNAATPDQPLGTLAGKGRLGGNRKGGKVVAKIDEIGYIMGIVSITPLIDYSQGNEWDVNLNTIDDFHKPGLDQIGFQQLITDQMAWWDTRLMSPFTPQFKSAGMQPAWINYMTSLNKVYGTFADQNSQMFMVLNRRYTPGFDEDGLPYIKDVTTYIDPTKFNQIFADTRRDSMNFWVQIGKHITCRRKISARQIPNL